MSGSLELADSPALRGLSVARLRGTGPRRVSALGGPVHILRFPHFRFCDPIDAIRACEVSAVARFVARTWPVKDPAGCAEFRGVGDGAAVACPGVVTFPAFAGWAALRPARLIGAVPLGAVQRTHYGPAITVGHEVTDVGVGELVVRGACHALVLRCGSDSRGSVVAPPHRRRIRPLHTYLDTPTYAPVIGVFYAP